MSNEEHSLSLDGMDDPQSRSESEKASGYTPFFSSDFDYWGSVLRSEATPLCMCSTYRCLLVGLEQYAVLNGLEAYCTWRALAEVLFQAERDGHLSVDTTVPSLCLSNGRESELAVLSRWKVVLAARYDVWGAHTSSLKEAIPVLRAEYYDPRADRNPRSRRYSLNTAEGREDMCRRMTRATARERNLRVETDGATGAAVLVHAESGELYECARVCLDTKQMRGEKERFQAYRRLGLGQNVQTKCWEVEANPDQVLIAGYQPGTHLTDTPKHVITCSPRTRQVMSNTFCPIQQAGTDDTCDDVGVVWLGKGVNATIANPQVSYSAIQHDVTTGVDELSAQMEGMSLFPPSVNDKSTTVEKTVNQSGLSHSQYVAPLAQAPQRGRTVLPVHSTPHQPRYMLGDTHYPSSSESGASRTSHQYLDETDVGQVSAATGDTTILKSSEPRALRQSGNDYLQSARGIIPPRTTQSLSPRIGANRQAPPAPVGVELRAQPSEATDASNPTHRNQAPRGEVVPITTSSDSTGTQVPPVLAQTSTNVSASTTVTTLASRLPEDARPKETNYERIVHKPDLWINDYSHKRDSLGNVVYVRDESTRDLSAEELERELSRALNKAVIGMAGKVMNGQESIESLNCEVQRTYEWFLSRVSAYAYVHLVSKERLLFEEFWEGIRTRLPHLTSCLAGAKPNTRPSYASLRIENYSAAGMQAGVQGLQQAEPPAATSQP